uniref:SH3 domain-containing protein n=1 Tax=Caenorhabditis japonica TaxID=281687 RepID=A0A8R1DFH6_CAEJA
MVGHSEIPVDTIAEEPNHEELLAEQIRVFDRLKGSKNFNRVAEDVYPVAVTKTKLVCELAVQEQHLNSKGTLHGGQTATLADVITARAVGVTIKNRGMVSVELAVSFHVKLLILGSQLSPPQKSIGSIADYDPMNGQWGTAAASSQRNSEKLGYLKSQVEKGPARFCADFAGAPPPSHTPSSLSSTSPHSTLSSPQSALSPQRNGAKAGFAVKAIYDYSAADKDEVSFLEGDVIVNCEKVDDGWMTGTVQRTLQWGMLPANYVQPHKLPTGLHRLS